MSGKIIIEINSDNYRVWHEHMNTINLMAQMNAKKCANKEEALEEVKKLLSEFKKYKEDPPYYHDFDD